MLRWISSYIISYIAIFYFLYCNWFWKAFLFLENLIKYVFMLCFYIVVLLVAWRAFTAQKWLPSMWSKSAPIKFLSRIKIAALGTKTLCFLLNFITFLRAFFSFSVQNLTQQRYINWNCRNCTQKLRSRIFLPRKRSQDLIQVNFCFRRNMQVGRRRAKWIKKKWISKSSKYFQSSWKMTWNTVSFKRSFPSTETIFHSPKWKKYALSGFSKFDTICC